MYLQVEALQGIPLFDHVSNNRKTEIPNLIKAILYMSTSASTVLQFYI